MATLLIDNYDSFTWNLVQYLWELGDEVEVVRNDQLSVEELLARRPDRIMVSPGPGNPDHAGVSVELIQTLRQQPVPLLGVCLGHQSLVVAFGGRIVRAQQIMHGKVSQISHDNEGVFYRLEAPLEVTRYHSLAAEESSLPADLMVTSRSEDGEIMGVRHRDLPFEGVQFHPESIATRQGHELLQNWLTGRHEAHD